jgi:hypothetical protein
VPRFFFKPMRAEAHSWLMRIMNALPKEQREWGRNKWHLAVLGMDRGRGDGDDESGP